MDNSFFSEFNELLKTIFTKEEPSIVPADDNFPTYLALRYISFYHPKLALFVNQTLNNYELIQNIPDQVEAYKLIKAVIPKAPWHFIKYVGKKKSKTQYQEGVKEEDIKRFAELLEISTREIRQYFRDMDELANRTSA